MGDHVAHHGREQMPQESVPVLRPEGQTERQVQPRRALFKSHASAHFSWAARPWRAKSYRKDLFAIYAHWRDRRHPSSYTHPLRSRMGRAAFHPDSPSLELLQYSGNCVGGLFIRDLFQ